MGSVTKDILDSALSQGIKIIPEYESKLVLREFGIPVVRENIVHDIDDAMDFVVRNGYPVVLKFCTSSVAHKTENDFVNVDLRSDNELSKALKNMSVLSNRFEGRFLVQEMVKGARELMLGMTRDPQFGPCVMFGLGGIFSEILRDISFRVTPIDKSDTFEMMQEIKGRKILGDIRGMEPVNLDVLAQSLIGLSELALQHEVINEIDINPFIVRGSEPVAVDALIVIRDKAEH